MHRTAELGCHFKICIWGIGSGATVKVLVHALE